MLLFKSFYFQKAIIACPIFKTYYNYFYKINLDIMQKYLIPLLFPSLSISKNKTSISGKDTL